MMIIAFGLRCIASWDPGWIKYGSSIDNDVMCDTDNMLSVSKHNFYLLHSVIFCFVFDVVSLVTTYFTVHVSAHSIHTIISQGDNSIVSFSKQ